MLILMSAANPNGYKLEDLLAQLYAELVDKNVNILGDTRDLSKSIQANNAKVLEHLEAARCIQIDSYFQIDNASADQLPLGKPPVT
jgi:hypothetical protein